MLASKFKWEFEQWQSNVRKSNRIDMAMAIPYTFHSLALCFSFISSAKCTYKYFHTEWKSQRLLPSCEDANVFCYSSSSDFSLLRLCLLWKHLLRWHWRHPEHTIRTFGLLSVWMCLGDSMNGTVRNVCVFQFLHFEYLTVVTPHWKWVNRVLADEGKEKHFPNAPISWFHSHFSIQVIFQYIRHSNTFRRTFFHRDVIGLRANRHIPSFWTSRRMLPKKKRKIKYHLNLHINTVSQCVTVLNSFAIRNISVEC